MTKTEKIGQIAAWMETARQQAANAAYYQGLLEKIGTMLGDEVYRTDDGEHVDQMLVSRVPDLVAARLGRAA